MPLQNFISLVNGKYDSIFGTQVSLGAASAGKIVALNSVGQIDSTMLPSSSGTVTSVSIVSANGFFGSVANPTTTPAITITTTISGILKGNGTAISAATSGVDYAPATSGSSILYGNGGGGFSNVTIGSGLSFSAGTLSAIGGSGTVTSVAISMPSAFSVSGSPITTNGTFTITGAGTSLQYIDGTGALQSFPSLTGYVPYVGATSDVDLGNFVLNAKAMHVKGVAGGGHLGLKHQSAAATGSANESLIYADSSGNLVWQNDNLYSFTLANNSFTANRSFTLPDSSGTIALLTSLSSTATGLTYTNTTGVFSLTSGYVIPTTSQIVSSLTTTGTSGAATFSSGTLNIPQYQSAYTILSTLGGLANSVGYLYNNGSGILSYATPTSGTVTSVTLSTPTGLQVSGGSTQTITTSGTFALTLTSGYTIPTTSQIISTFTTTGSSGAATFASGTLNIPNYTADGILPSQTGNSGKYLTTNGTTASWGTITAMINPMTTQGDTIYGGVSGTPTRLALGTTNYFYQAGATTPQWFNLFGAANTFTEAQSITKTQTTPLYGVVITNSNGGNSYTNTGSGVQLISNSSTASIEYNNSTGVTVNDKTIRYVSPNGHTFLTGGTTGSTAYNYYWECVSSASYMRLLQSASSPRTLLELFNSNAGSTYVELRLNAGSAPIGLIGKSSMFGVGISPTSTLHNSGSFAQNLATKTANYTLTSTDYCVVFSGSTVSQTMTLPTAVGITGRIYEIANAGSVSITIATTSAQTFINVTATPTTLTLAANTGSAIKVISNGANWVVLNQ